MTKSKLTVLLPLVLLVFVAGADACQVWYKTSEWSEDKCGNVDDSYTKLGQGECAEIMADEASSFRVTKTDNGCGINTYDNDQCDGDRRGSAWLESGQSEKYVQGCQNVMTCVTCVCPNTGAWVLGLSATALVICGVAVVVLIRRRRIAAMIGQLKTPGDDGYTPVEEKPDLEE